MDGGTMIEQWDEVWEGYRALPTMGGLGRGNSILDLK